MNTHHAESFEPRSETETRWHGYRLVLVWLVCITLSVVSVGLFVASIPSYVAHLHLLCTGTAAVCNTNGQLTAGDVRRLHELGLSRDFYATYTIVLASMFALGYWLVAAFLFWRKSDNRLSLLAAVSLATFPIVFYSGIQTLPWPRSFLAPVISLLGSLCLLLFFYVFPSGHFVPRWTRWVLVVALLYFVFVYFFPASSLNPFSHSQVLNVLTIIGLIGSIVVVQIYRYRRVSSPAQRQQTKWVVYGMSMGWGGYLVLHLIVLHISSLFFPSLYQTGSLVDLIYFTAVSGLLLLVPLSIGLAILRSRLWDIDLIINRTLVYGGLSGTLLAVYAGCIVLLQALLRGLFNQTSDVAIVVSTLVIAALFQPLRKRIQEIIDRRFYRRKYDAARTLAAFSATLRNKVDLEQLREDLVAVVQETMQPSHVSLWLRPPEQASKKQATWSSTPPAPQEGEEH